MEERKTFKGRLRKKTKIENTDTYDIQVRRNSNFFVKDEESDKAVLVHNSEIILRPYEFCNLSEVIVKPEDTMETLKEKVRVATILGTFQSTLTDFRYLSKRWKENCEEERLLGVSMTGIYDNPLTYKLEGLPDRLNQLKQVAIETNKIWAEKLGINQSAAITCVKPSGNVSQLTDTASGIHPRYSKYYVRTVRGDKKDPLTQYMMNAGFPYEDCVSSPETTAVFEFPVKCPDTSVFKDEVSALDQCELWLMYQRHWCEHKPSCSVYVREDEWLKVGAWVYEHFDEISGLSFFPYDDHVYDQAPYQPCSEEDYEELKKLIPEDVDWTELAKYEKEDTTRGSQTLACTAGSCEIVDLT
jgi:ribonucleoside-triphosphate reductase